MTKLFFDSDYFRATLVTACAGMLVGISSVVTYSTPCLAQSESDAPRGLEPRIEVLHTPLNGAEIPPVGSLMRIQVLLTNTIDIESKLRLVGAKDGRFIDIAFPQGALNHSDKAAFVAEIPSPIAAMSYQFIVHQKDGTLSSSRTFTIKRPCIQNFTVKVADDKSTTSFRREIASLVTEANRLERDNKSLESSLKLVEEMRSLFAQ